MGTTEITLLVVAFLPAVIFFVRRAKGWTEKQIVLTTGQSAQATIVKTWETGTLINDDPEVGMALDVHPATGVSFQAQATCVVPQIRIPRVQPGS